MVVRWNFTDVWTQETWTFPVNPNEGGTPNIEKDITVQTNTGPHRGGIIQEGRTQVPTIQFSGVILTQEHLEMLEEWYMKRALLELEDDLGRTFRGVFQQFSPSRIRRPYRPWYHEYQASFLVWGYRNAGGVVIFGNFT